MYMFFLRALFIFTTVWFISLGAYSQASHVIDSLEHELKIAAHDSVRVNALFALFKQYEAKHPSKALQYANRTIKIGGASQNQEWLYLGHFTASWANANQGHYKMALAYAQKAYEAANALGDSTKMATTSNNIGAMYIDMGNYKESIEPILRALSLTAKNKRRNAAIMAHLNLGRSYMHQNQVEQARWYFKEAKELGTSIQDQYSLAFANLGLGLLNKRECQEDTALVYFNKSLALCQKAVPFMIAEVISHIGDVYTAKGQYIKAMDTYKIAYENNQATENYHRMAQNLLAIGQLHMANQQSDKAESQLKKGLQFAQEDKNKPVLPKIHQALAQLYETRQDYKKAYHHFKQYTALEKSINDLDIRKQITGLQTAYELKRKDRTIALLNNDMSEQKSQITQQRVQNIILFMSLAFLAILAALLTYNNLNKRKTNRLLLVRQKEIQKQSKKLQELNLVKNKFFTIVSHDLRAPFHSLSGVLELISSGMVSEAEIKDLSLQLKVKFDKTKQLLDNLLEWGRIQIKEVKYEPTDVVLHDAVEDVLNVVRGAYDKPVSLHNHVDSEHTVMADINMLQLILRNLVANGIKFTEDGGTINIGADLDGDFVCVSVADNGIGISKENQKKLFHKGNSYTTLGTDNEAGTGLGLNLCKEFVIKNGGSIWVESEVGKGSAFKFTLKKAEHAEIE